MDRHNHEKTRLSDLLRHSSSYEARKFGRTGKTDERIKVATWLKSYKKGENYEPY